MNSSRVRGLLLAASCVTACFDPPAAPDLSADATTEAGTSSGGASKSEADGNASDDDDDASPPDDDGTTTGPGTATTDDGGTSMDTGGTRPIESICGTGMAQCTVEGIPEVCSDDGQWQTEDACEAPTPHCVAGRCVECLPGEPLRCSVDGTPQACSPNGAWLDQAPCAPQTPACLDGECRPCSPDSRRCESGVPQLCSAEGDWEDRAPCDATEPVCIEATGQCGSCDDGDRQCGSPTTPQQCNATGEFEDQPACAGATPACFGGACAQCNPNSAITRRCVGSTPEICNPTGSWVAQAPCSGELSVCDQNTGTCICDEGTSTCAGGIERACSGGVVRERECSFGCMGDACFPETVGIAGLVSCRGSNVENPFTCDTDAGCQFDPQGGVASCGTRPSTSGLLTCDGPNDCPGQQCCMGYALCSTFCADTCPDVAACNPGVPVRQVCDPDVPGTCPRGTACSSTPWGPNIPVFSCLPTLVIGPALPNPLEPRI